MVSVIAPTLNEVATIGSVLSRTHSTLHNIGVPYEVIVVDNGSTDRTVEIAYRCGAEIISNGRNLGKGSSIRKGIHHARGLVIITLDTDGENQPEDIPRLLDLISNENVDIVIGSRFMGDRARGRRGVHILGNKIINMLIFLLTGSWVTDSQSGFRVIKRRVLQSINLESRGYEIEAEMTVKVLKKGFIVKEVPITYNKLNNGSSKLHTFKDGFKIIKTILKVFFTT